MSIYEAHLSPDHQTLILCDTNWRIWKINVERDTVTGSIQSTESFPRLALTNDYLLVGNYDVGIECYVLSSVEKLWQDDSLPKLDQVLALTTIGCCVREDELVFLDYLAGQRKDRWTNDACLFRYDARSQLWCRYSGSTVTVFHDHPRNVVLRKKHVATVSNAIASKDELFFTDFNRKFAIQDLNTQKTHFVDVPPGRLSCGIDIGSTGAFFSVLRDEHGEAQDFLDVVEVSRESNQTELVHRSTEEVFFLFIDGLLLLGDGSLFDVGARRSVRQLESVHRIHVET